MLLTLLVAAQAATVTVNGGEGCVSAAAVQFELDATEGLIGSDRVLVDLVRLEEPWQLHIRVVRREVEVWRRSLEVTEADCALLPAALARSLERGLEGVPRWPFAGDRRSWFVGVQTATSWPFLEWSAALATGQGPRPRGVWSWEADVTGFTRGVQPVGQGRASLSGLMVGVAPVVEARVGATRFGVVPRAAAGWGWATGSGFNKPLQGLGGAPRVAGTVEGRVRFPQGIHVGVQGTVLVVGATYVDTRGGSVTHVDEPPWRLGLRVGYRTGAGR